ncbi:hypothetical protein Ciccas_004912, partial [Cichlidogyrus casuarinus]
MLIAAPTQFPLVPDSIRFPGPAFASNIEPYWQREYYVLTPPQHAYISPVQTFKATPDSIDVDVPEPPPPPSQMTFCYQVPTFIQPSFDRVASPSSNGKEFSPEATSLISYTGSPMQASTVASSGAHSPINRLLPPQQSLQ